MTVVDSNPVIFTHSDVGRLKLLLQAQRTRMVEGRMASVLKGELDRGHIVHPRSIPKGTVTMNSKVRLRDIRTGQRMTYTLVYPEQANIEEGWISVLAPVGAAILGASEGKVVECQTPGGLRRIRIERVLYQPESAGNYEL